jgi:hypothetical protein
MDSSAASVSLRRSPETAGFPLPAPAQDPTPSALPVSWPKGGCITFPLCIAYPPRLTLIFVVCKIQIALRRVPRPRGRLRLLRRRSGKKVVHAPTSIRNMHHTRHSQAESRSGLRCRWGELTFGPPPECTDKFRGGLYPGQSTRKSSAFSITCRLYQSSHQQSVIVGNTRKRCGDFC